MRRLLILTVAGILIGCSQSDEPAGARTTETDDGLRDAAGHDTSSSTDTNASAVVDTDASAEMPADAGDVADAGDGSSSTTEECFSPTAPDSTYEDGASGCKCEGLEGRAVAVGHAVLSCHNGVWVPAEDGPAARGDSCAATVDDVTACLEAFMSCSENADGTFCGRDPV